MACVLLLVKEETHSIRHVCFDCKVQISLLTVLLLLCTGDDQKIKMKT